MRKVYGLCFAALVLTLVSANLAMAGTIYVTPTGSTAGGESVSATADFSVTGDILTVTLTNNLPGIHDAGQLLTDLFFTVSGPATGLSLSSETGDLVEVAKGGGVTNLGSSTLGWGFGAATVGKTSGFEVCVICQGGPHASATPSEGILGPPSGGGQYSSANSSIGGNKPHNPFVNQTATFTFTDFPAGDTIGKVEFSFSTTDGVNVGGTPVTTTPTPEPASLALLGTALIGAAWLLRRKLTV